MCYYCIVKYISTKTNIFSVGQLSCTEQFIEQQRNGWTKTKTKMIWIIVCTKNWSHWFDQNQTKQLLTALRVWAYTGGPLFHLLLTVKP